MIYLVKRPKAVLLDWDNTLVDSWAIIHSAMRTTLLELKRHPWTLEETKQRTGYSLRDSFPTLFRSDWQRAKRIFYEAFEEQHLKLLKPLPGAGELLKNLYAKGIYLGIVSNKTGRYLRIEAEYLGWHRYLTQVIGAGDAARDKPAKEALIMALAGSNIIPGKNVWFVGDSTPDMQVAHNAGCLPVLLRANSPNPGEFMAFPPAWHATSCSDLEAKIIGL